MGLYKWRARGEDGGVYEGSLAAESMEQAAAIIRTNYGYVVSLAPLSEKQNGLTLSLRGEHYNDQQRMLFFSQLSALLRSGIPILRAVELLGRRGGAVYAHVCGALEAELVRGCSLAESMEKRPRFFTPLASALTEAGEKSGELPFLFAELAACYARQYELKRICQRACMYPSALIIFSLLVLLLFLLYVLPLLGETYRALNIRQEGVLFVLLDALDWLKEHKLFLLSVGAGIFFSAWRQRNFLLRLFYRLPVVRALRESYNEARFCKLLALLLDGGVNILDAVATAGASVRDEAFSARLAELAASLKRGESLGDCAAAKAMFSALALEFISIGEASGNLPAMLRQTALLREQDFQDGVDRLREFLQPLLLVTAALVVGTVLCSVLQPLFSLLDTLPVYG